MKCFRRCLSLLLCSVSLLVVFSAPVSAEEITVPPYHINASVTHNGQGNSINIFPNDDEVQSNGFSHRDVVAGQQKVYYTLYFATDDNTALFEAGKTYDVVIENIYWDILCSGTVVPITDEEAGYIQTMASSHVEGYLVDGTNDQVGNSANGTVEQVWKTDGTVDLKFTYTPSQNVERLRVLFVFKFKTLETTDIVVHYGEQDLTTKFFYLKVDRKTDEEGLLADIWGSLTEGFSNMVNAFKEKIGDLKESTVQGFNDVKSGLQGVLDSIINLPQKIWEWIENGLKNLFVPDEDYMVGYKDKWDSLLEEKLGAVYQVVNLTFESWDNIMDADESNSIHLPNVSIGLPEGENFAFGDEDIQIVPVGFEFVADALKVLMGGLCTLMFINGLRKRYDQLMGGH